MIIEWLNITSWAFTSTAFAHDYTILHPNTRLLFVHDYYYSNYCSRNTIIVSSTLSHAKIHLQDTMQFHHTTK